MATQSRIGWRPYVTQVVNTVDADATAFIAAAGITDLTQASAITTLVNDLKAYGLWTKMKALYPFVGGSAASHKFNLKDPRDLDAAYRLVFNGGWTHTGTGAQPNGTTGYANTYYNPSSLLNPFIGYYSRSNTNTNTDQIDMGCSNTGLKYLYVSAWYKTNTYNNIFARNSSASVLLDGGSPTDSRGWYWTNKISTTAKLGKNGSLLTSSTDTTTAPNVNIFIGSLGNEYGSGQYFSNRETGFSIIGDGLTDTDTSNLYISVQKFQTTLGRHVGTPYVSDPDAIAFLMAAGITDGTQATAINTLVIRMKADGVWTKMKAIYPFVGGNATSHKFNLKDPRDLDAAYRLVFSGGWIHSSTGALPNGTTGYADTKLVPSSTLSLNSTHILYYSRTNISTMGSDFGTIGSYTYTNNLYGYIKYNDGKTYFRINRGGTLESSIDIPDSRLFYMMNRTSSSQEILFTNTTKNTFNYNSTGLSPFPVFLGASNKFGTGAFEYSSRESAFATIGDGLTDTEALAFYNAVQAYQTTLGRQVNIPLVSDTDAQTFLNAANITSFQQASAVNKLVVDLKAAGVWTKMKAIYPFVGGSATSHKFNLKDPRDSDDAFRLVFNGGWTHSSTGALPNGTTGYADTKMNANSTNFDYQSMSTTFYSRTNNSLGVNDIGVQTGSNKRFIELNIKEGNLSYMALSHQGISYLNFTNNDSRGFYHSNRIDSNTIKLYKNGTNVATGTQTSTNIYGEYSVYISALNARHNNNQVLYFSNREVSFTTLGSGLTDTESTALYTAVQTYQTTLGRAVDTPVYNNGLVLNLDAGNANSYPGTGTTWFDLASGNNGTLTNGPTYDTTNGGSILFDGVNDYVELGSNFKFVDKDLTLDFWIKCTDNSNVYHDIILMAKSDQSTGVGLLKSRSGTNNGGSIYFYFGNNYLVSSMTGTQLVAAGIVNYTAVAKKESGLYKIYLYRNGVLDGSLNTTISTYDMNTFTNFFARIGSGGPSFPEIWQGNIYSGKVYTRALSATEILSSFNSTRGRFGL